MAKGGGSYHETNHVLHIKRWEKCGIGRLITTAMATYEARANTNMSHGVLGRCLAVGGDGGVREGAKKGESHGSS